MATIQVQNETIEVTVNGYNSPSFYAKIRFKDKNTKEDMVKQLTLPLSASNRQECTFDLIQEEIDEYLEEKDDIEVEELSSIIIEEREKIKTGFD